ncbi:20549_t:CDS:2, partial [Gigaspora margarita]
MNAKQFKEFIEMMSSKLMEANNWNGNHKLQIALGNLKEAAADWYSKFLSFPGKTVTPLEKQPCWQIELNSLAQQDHEIAIAAPKSSSKVIAVARRIEAGNCYSQHNSEIAKQVKIKNELSNIKKRIDEIVLNYAALAHKLNRAGNR